MDRGITSTWIAFVLLGGLAPAGCGEPVQKERAEAVEEAREPDAIRAFEQPEALVGGASRRLSDNIRTEDIGKDFGLPDWRAPYPDTYWAFTLGGTDARWNARGLDARTPIEKYMAIIAPYAAPYAKAWEYWNHGQGAPGVSSWNGHCPGWAGASMSNAPIRHPVFAGSNGLRGIAACNEGTPGCVRFEIGDVNALMAEVYLDGPTSRIGLVCGTPASAIPRDQNGRILREGCAGVNPGTLLIAASTLLRRYQIPFAIDGQNPSNTDQIWTQPTYRYHIHDFRGITMAQAANLVAHGNAVGAETYYRWNRAAAGFAFLDLGLRFVGEDHAHLTFLSGARSTYEMRVAAVLELDADASSPQAVILGGEYLDLPSRGVNRLTVSPFLWVSQGPGQDNLPLYSSSVHHNPFIQPSLVRVLIALGQQ